MIGTLVGEWRTVDKSAWGEGPWQQEPDKVHWIDAATWLDCLMVRNDSGNWCGYVGVVEGHPWYGLDYSSGCPKQCGESYCEHAPQNHVEVHGGLTFADFCAESVDESKGICHVAQPGRPEKVWWFGFDCAHCDDMSPGRAAREREHGWRPIGGNIYRDRGYVESQVTNLAAQLAAAAPVENQ